MQLQKTLSDFEEIYMENWRTVLKPRLESVLKERASVSQERASVSQESSSNTSYVKKDVKLLVVDSHEEEAEEVPSFLSKRKAPTSLQSSIVTSNSSLRASQQSSQQSNSNPPTVTKGKFPPPRKTTIVLDYTSNIHALLIPEFDTPELKKFKTEKLDKNAFKAFICKYGQAWMLFKGSHASNKRVIDSYKFPYISMTKEEYESDDRDSQIVEKEEKKPKYKFMETTENKYNNQVNGDFVYIKLAGISENLCIGTQNTKLDASKVENKGLKSVFALDSDDMNELRKKGIRVFDVNDAEIVALTKKSSVYMNLVALKLKPLNVSKSDSDSSGSFDSSSGSFEEESSSNDESSTESDSK